MTCSLLGRVRGGGGGVGTGERGGEMGGEKGLVTDFSHFSPMFHRFVTHAGTGTDFSHMPSTKKHVNHRNNS